MSKTQLFGVEVQKNGFSLQVTQKNTFFRRSTQRNIFFRYRNFDLIF